MHLPKGKVHRLNIRFNAAHDMATLDDIINVPPSEARGFLVAAQGMLAGAIPLRDVTPLPALALTLLCGHACEAALKALLAHGGKTAAELSRKPYGHDLLYLWVSVPVNHGSVSVPSPPWLEQLDRVYDRPFIARYPLRINGLVLPDQRAMLDGTQWLVSLAASVVG